jgi:two-component system, NtrC family, nitrogen regulation sensor histidine kinase NtrY
LFTTFSGQSFSYRSPDAMSMGSALERTVREKAAQTREEVRWALADNNRLVSMVQRNPNEVWGVIAPRSVHEQWQSLMTEVSRAEPGVELLRLSYYSMLGVLTLLVVFSATWLGFTIAREMTVPIQVLAEATEAVAAGDYDVRIDDIVSDDELGTLARSFRSMVSDLHAARQGAQAASQELQVKADELFQKSVYNSVLLRDINAAVITCSPQGIIRSWNQEAGWLFDVEEKQAVQASLAQVLPAPFFQVAIVPLLERVSVAGEARAVGEFSGKIGNEDCQLEITISLVKTLQAEADRVIFINDITALARAQRVAAWRDVARRIAHEIKNPLTPIKLGAQRLQMRFGNRFESEDARVFEECVKVVLHSTESIKGLVDEFIRFARMPQPVLRRADIRETVRMAVAGFGENPEHVHVRLSEEPSERCMVWHDSDQMGRLCANLITNAIAASVPCGAQEVQVALRLNTSARYVQIEVCDWGIGIPIELKARIFEPYFSTKRTGMGIGLVIVNQIVADHRGRMSVEENIPKGTAFVVEIPIGD